MATAGVVVLAVLACAHAASTGESSVNATTSPLGAYGGEDPSAENALASAIGRKPGYAMAFLDGSSWQKMEDPSWFISQFAGSGYSMIWGVSILPSSGDSTLAAGAIGAYNQYYVTLAKGLVAGGQGSSIIRLGWEFNGSWFPWAANGQAANFVAYWQQIVTSMRSVAGANFKFEWNPTSGDQGAGDLAQYYPGNAYVDLIGLDVYDVSWGSYPGASSEFSTILTEPYGLNWLASFAAAQGKPMTLPEWGLGWGLGNNGQPVTDPGNETSGGDDPTFINDMANWIASHDVFEATLWQVNESAVTTSQNQNSLAAVAKDFGAGATLPPPPVTPPSTTTTTLPPAKTTTPAPATVKTTTPSPSVSIGRASSGAFRAFLGALFLKKLEAMKPSVHLLSSIRL